MTTKARWQLSDSEERKVSLKLQKAERKFRRLQALNEISGSLRIEHESDLETICTTLGMMPDDAVRKGDVLTSTGPFEVVANRASWTLSSVGKVKDNRIEVHIKWLLDQVTGKLPGLRCLQESGAKTSIFIHTNSWTRLQSFELDVDTLLLLARYGLSIRMNVLYQNTGEEY
jgi:hypothetical protein